MLIARRASRPYCCFSRSPRECSAALGPGGTVGAHIALDIVRGEPHLRSVR
jgi:hypothetical protein